MVLCKCVFTWDRSNCCVLAYGMANFPIICAIETIVRIFWLAKWQSNCRIKQFICQLILNFETCSIFTRIIDSLFDYKNAESILLTDLGDEMCWWQFRDIGDWFEMLMTDLLYCESDWPHAKVLSLISENCYHHKVNNKSTKRLLVKAFAFTQK